MFETSRRRVLQGIGAGSMVAIAGCNATTPQDEMQTPTPTEDDETVTADVDRVAADPTAIPNPITRSEPAEVDVTLEPKEVTAELEDGKTFDYMTYNRQIPGPFIRVRVGDTVNLTFRNPEENVMVHNVDFHAVAGLGGGGDATMTNPGETTHLRFKVTYPGAFAYHCAVPGDIDMHISSGMFGIILVEPEEGLPDVDHEFYLGQHEIYAEEADDRTLRLDMEAMASEEPAYVLINGEAAAITPDRHGPMEVRTDDTARVYFVTGGPNCTSSLHPVGSVWDELWPQGSLSTEPQTHIQTMSVPPGSTTIATMSFPVPGDFVLVDHALSRVTKKGCMAVVRADGPENTEIFDPDPKQ